MYHGSPNLMKSISLGNAIFDGREVRKGYLRVEDDTVVEVCSGAPPGKTVKGLVLPAFINAHTHIGDSFAYPAPSQTLENLVASPDGYKHQRLRSASKDLKKKGMLESLGIMASCGTSVFADFREEGLEGVRMLDESLRPNHPRAIRLSRPSKDDADTQEIDALLEISDGIGMSSISDHPMDFLSRLSSAARSRGKLFSIHLSENRREDVDIVLSLHPDFVIHATMAAWDDLEALASSRTPVVVCPTSNEFFGISLDIPKMLSSDVMVGLGTDNGMICKPDMFVEMRTAFRISVARGGVTPLEIVRMATVQGRKVLRAEGNTTAGATNEHDFVVVRVPGRDPLKELVTTVGSDDVLAVVRGRKVRRSADWR